VENFPFEKKFSSWHTRNLLCNPEKNKMKPATPLPASTVVLLRDGKNGLEVYLLQKSRSLEFAGGAFVFPGGSLEQEDKSPEWLSYFSKEKIKKLHEKITDIPQEKVVSFYVAGMRELFEEAGILLADNQPAEKERIKLRQSLLEGGSFLNIAKKSGFQLLPEKLIYYAHWITPQVYPIRFSARFFLAESPQDQEPSPDGREMLQGIWISPQNALCENLPLMTPTAITLQELSHFQYTKEALAFGENRIKIPRQPWVDEKGEIHLT
jgi:8-oxo-dGTP pyrophosphatase MutT (NUDIX family)